ncbi:Glycosyl hydrolase family 12 [Rhizoctonia solani]|uniref:Glycosyl hydrolase family 12 n=1 Tax=Rhizoctonia solani TaxID=456999 RepID=A0A8H7IMC2_9AGAM|nr:Glycosyl hydrolase family 12 [Rhizoctonia solani]
MVKIAVAATFFVLTGLASASPAPLKTESNLEKRFNLLSGQWDSENIGNGQYMLYNNLWGKSKPGTSGLRALRHSPIVGPPSAGGHNTRGAAILMICKRRLTEGTWQATLCHQDDPTTWRWTYSAAASDLVANVSYDLWLSNVPNGTGHSTTSTYEIMIWLSNRRAGPAGSQVATTTIGGQSWKVFKGRVETWDVYSFVASNELTNYNADLKPFFAYFSTKS